MLALSTGNKIGLALVAAVFIAFALASAFLIPRYRPEFPGSGGLRLFIVLTVLLFGAMMAAVAVFGREEEEPGHSEEPAVEEAAAPAPAARPRAARLLL